MRGDSPLAAPHKERPSTDAGQATLLGATSRTIALSPQTRGRPGRGHDRGRPGRGRRGRGAGVRRGRGSDRHCRCCHGHGHGREGGVRGGPRGEWMVIATMVMVVMVSYNDSD